MPLADSEEQRRRSQEEADDRQRLQDAPQVRLQEPEALAEAERGLALPAETPSFRIERLVLALPEYLPADHRARGESQRPGAPFRFALRYLRQYRGKAIGPEGIKLIMRRLTHQILARGYTTTRVELPEQDLSRGTLTLTLIPGIIRAIRFADPEQPGSWRAAFPARPGDLLNLRDLEQGLEQMKRVPSQDVAIAIVPGAAPGESEIVLTRKRARPWRGTASLDDSGLPATGQWQAGVSGAYDNLFGCSDLFNAGVSHDATAYRKGSGTQGGNLAYSVPWGYWTFAAAWNQQDFDQRIAGINQDFVSSGTSRNLDFRVSRLVQRTQTRKETLQLRVGQRSSRSFLNGVEIDVQRRNNSFAELSLNHTQYLGRAQLELSAAARRGVSWFGAQPDLQAGGPTFYYRLQTLDASLSVPFAVAGQRLQYTATVRGQRSSNSLYASEYFTIGNRWSVRGFNGDRTLAADNGAFWRNDLEWPFSAWGSLYLGADTGRVYGPSEQNLPGRTLAGMVLGLKGALQRRLSFNVFVGGPLHQPTGFSLGWPVAGVAASWHF